MFTEGLLKKSVSQKIEHNWQIQKNRAEFEGQCSRNILDFGISTNENSKKYTKKLQIHKNQCYLSHFKTSLLLHYILYTICYANIQNKYKTCKHSHQETIKKKQRDKHFLQSYISVCILCIVQIY